MDALLILKGCDLNHLGFIDDMASWSHDGQWKWCFKCNGLLCDLDALLASRTHGAIRLEGVSSEHSLVVFLRLGFMRSGGSDG